MNSKQERLLQTLNSLLDKLDIPPTLKMLLPNLTGNLTQSLHQLSDEDIDDLLQTIEKYIAFIRGDELVH